MPGEFQIAFQQHQRYICDINAPTGLNLNLPQSYHKCVASFSWHDSNSYFSTIMPEYVVVQISYFWNANWAWIRFRVVILIHISECKPFQSVCNFDGSWPLLSKCVSWHRSGEWISNAAWARIFICNESTKISVNLSSWFSKYVLVTKLSDAIPSCFDFAYFKSWKQCFLSWWVALEWV